MVKKRELPRYYQLQMKACFKPGRFAANTPYSKTNCSGSWYISTFRFSYCEGKLTFDMHEKHRAHELTVANKEARLDRSRLLLRRYPASLVHFIWFSNEKLCTVASPSNTQNDRLYVAVGTRMRDIAAGRLLRTRPTFSKSLMVSVGVSSLGRTSIHFVEPMVKNQRPILWRCFTHGRPST